MAKFKLDTKSIKEFVTARYEIVALGVGGVLAFLCLIYGVSAFFSESSPDQQIAKDAKAIEDKRLSISDGEVKTSTSESPSKWGTISPKEARFAMMPLFEQGAAGDNRRFNPQIKAVDSGENAFQLDYILKGVYLYDVNPTAQKLAVFKAAGAIDPVFVVEERRMVVVSATFPYFDQAEAFRKALRFDRLEDMFAKGLAPTFEGLVVERRKITKEGGKDKLGEWQSVYKVDPATGKAQPSDAIAQLLQRSIYDDSQVDKYADVIYGASVTPLPIVASNKIEYPEIKLAGIKDRVSSTPTPVGEKGFNKEFGSSPSGIPGGVGAAKLPVGRPRYRLFPTTAADERTVETKSYTDLTVEYQDLKDQLTGHINWTSPYGTFPDEPGVDPKDPKNGEPRPPDPKDVLKGRPPAKGGSPGSPGTIGPGPGPGMPEYGMFSNLKAPNFPPANPKALIRFIDVDVEPGAEYQYRVAVRIANPNYKQSTKVVAHPGLAKIKEFVSEWVETPRIAIPEEFQFYVINQERYFYTDPRLGKWSIDRQIGSAMGDRVPFQIHKFVGSFVDASKKGDRLERYVAEWLVAERVLVGKGEAIGREVEIEAITWNRQKGSFEIGSASASQPKDKGKGKKLPAAPTGIMVDFKPNKNYVVLDFVGGKHQKYAPKTSNPIDEESAMEVLIMMPDGTMVLRNGRNDMDDRGWDNAEKADLGGHPLGIERRTRWSEWSTRLDEFRQASAPQNPFMPGMPPAGKGGGSPKGG